MTRFRCVSCDTPLIGRRTGYCSKACENKVKIARMPDVQAVRRRYPHQQRLAEIARVKAIARQLPPPLTPQTLARACGLSTRMINALLARFQFTLDDLTRDA